MDSADGGWLGRLSAGCIGLGGGAEVERFFDVDFDWASEDARLFLAAGEGGPMVKGEGFGWL